MHQHNLIKNLEHYMLKIMKKTLCKSWTIHNGLKVTLVNIIVYSNAFIQAVINDATMAALNPIFSMAKPLISTPTI